MKKFLFLFILVITSIVTFSQIMIPEDSIPRLISETVEKNNLKNPDRLYIGQEILLYFGDYVKLPVLVKVKNGDNLNNLLHYQIATMSQFDQNMRNNIYETMRFSRSKAELTASPLTTSISQDRPEIPTTVKWSILGIFLLVLIASIDLLKRIKKR